MKILIMSLVLIISKLSFATVIEVNAIEKKVYYHPTPVLEISLIDLATDGGVLMLSLDYNSQLTNEESNNLKSLYADYKFQVVMAELLRPEFELSIPEINLKKELFFRQGQLGPYLNSQINLTQEQVQKLKLNQKIIRSLNFSVQSKVRYISQSVVESYNLAGQSCSDLKVTNVKDIIQNLSQLKRPLEIKYSETFESLKISIIAKCFDANPQIVESFSELMRVPLNTLSPVELKGEYFQPRSQEKVIDIKPLISVKL